MLWLPIKQRWFNLILQGTKKEEYREPKPYWLKRIAKDIGIQNMDISNINQIIRSEINIAIEDRNGLYVYNDIQIVPLVSYTGR